MSGRPYRRVTNRKVALLTALLLATGCFAVDAPPASARAEALREDADVTAAGQIDATFEKYDTLGGCVCVIENGEVSHTFCYGVLAPGGDPVTEDTLFRVGSISKMVTAVGIMRQVEDGAVSLDADLSDTLGVTLSDPYYRNAVITLRQVMSHTAALRDGGLYEMALEGNARTLTELFSPALSRYAFIANNRPGTRHDYSNFGGGLLGSVLEALTGQTVDAYMTKNIFAPLGITAAYRGSLLSDKVTVSDMYTMPSRRRSASVREDTEAETVANPMVDYTLTAGKLTISAPDLAKILIALSEGGVYENTRLLSESAAAEMRTPQNRIGSVTGDSNWGLNMLILTDTLVEGRTLYGHGGKANGMLCSAYFDPEDRTGVVMLTNGCNNHSQKDGVGMLSVKMINLCYDLLIDDAHVTLNPWLVGNGGYDTVPEG